MKTIGQVLTYLEMELTDAYEMYDDAKGVDPREATIHLVRATTILHIIEAILDQK